jgi:hypothetical protein
VFHPSEVGISRRCICARLIIYLIDILCEGACYSSIVVLLREAHYSSSSCSLDSSIQREVHLHRRVARRIDVPHLQVACIAHMIGRFIRSIGSEGAS